MTVATFDTPEEVKLANSVPVGMWDMLSTIGVHIVVNDGNVVGLEYDK